MAHDLFSYAPINPIRAAQVVTFDPRYHTKPFDYRLPDECYLQPWELTDHTTIQVISDYFPTMKWYEAISGDMILEVPFVAIPNSIQNQTFLAFNAEVLFSDLGIGNFYFEITYFDILSNPQVWQSDICQVLGDHENTILFEYTNSQNDFSSIFDTGTIFNLRTQGSINLYKPEFNNVIYNDINENITKLYGDPYRSFTLFVAYNYGVADWMVDKVNRIMACDQIKIDGIYYDMADGAKWEESRSDQYSLLGASISIQEVENRFLDKLILGPTPDDNDILIVQKEQNYFNQGSNITASGIFKKFSELEKFTVYKRGTNFTLKVGITNGGSEIGEWDVSELITTFPVNYAFDEPKTVYFTGWVVGTLNDVCVVYLQYDAPPISGTINPYKNLGLGATMIYSAPVGQAISVDFNLGTGLGNIDTDWFGWAVCDGRNGTDDYGLIVPMGFKQGNRFSDLGMFDGSPALPAGKVANDIIDIGDIMGEFSHLQTSQEVGPHTHPIDNSNNDGGAGKSAVGGNAPEGLLATQLNTYTGSQIAMNIIQKSKYCLYVKKINN